MRIVAVSRVLDEVDIIEAFIRHAAAFVDHHVVLDNGSRDGTVEILRRLAEEGLSLTVYRSPSICFSERDMNNWLYNEAVDRHDADWVACLDSDEFYDDRQLPGGLRAYLGELENSGGNVAAVRMPWAHYNYRSQDDATDTLVPRRITHRTEVMPGGKVIASWRLGKEKGLVLEGQHDVFLPEGSRGTIVTEPRLWIAHFSVRSTAQYVTKNVRGWAKVLTAGRECLERRHSAHYCEPFELLRDRPGKVLRSRRLIERENEERCVIHDPIDYRGGPLRYTPPYDPEMQSVRALIGFLSDVCTRYGELTDALPAARAHSEQIERRIDRLI
ncbi:glycosyltransferase family 2 protein [Methylorubrum sp. SB2]|uniref:glycosyltransferase family 2 protein n=1 Tax=Methylorubrum subtropicum TaxID=3138812 RepID=UPI00313F3C21